MPAQTPMILVKLCNVCERYNSNLIVTITFLFALNAIANQSTSSNN